MPNFNAYLAPADDGCRIKLSGEFDLTCRDLAAAVLSQTDGEPRVVLDLSELDFIDSTGIHFVVAAHEQARQRGCDFTIVRGGPAVERVFSLVGLDQALPFA